MVTNYHKRKQLISPIYTFPKHLLMMKTTSQTTTKIIMLLIINSVNKTLSFDVLFPSFSFAESPQPDLEIIAYK